MKNGRRRRCWGYVARGAPYGPDDGTLSPPAMLASLPFAPEMVMAATRHVCRHYPQVADERGLRNGFNPTWADGDSQCWVSTGHFGLDQGIIILMIENHRSQFIWNLMRECPYIRLGLRRAGFNGGWL
jgi:hypothetical protein